MRPPDDLPGVRSVPLISVRELTKRFPGVVANDSVSLDLLPGEVHALLGENGAGKTTLISMLYGLLQPDGGSIAMDAQRVTIKNPRHAMDLGIGLVAQHFNLARRHTVAENLAVGLRGTPFWRPTRALQRRAAELTERYGLAVRMNAQVAALSPGERQRVEILKAVMQGARLLILDEPTSVLTPQEADALLKVVTDMRRDGRGILFISHKLGEVLRVADRITVLRGGKVVGRRARGGVEASELARLMVGAPTATPQRLGIPPEGEPVLRVSGVWVRGRRGPALRGLDLEVRPGEVLGVAGVAGNGQSELAQVLTGLARPEKGSVTLAGADIGRLSPREVRKLGVAYIPEDRRAEGVAGTMSVAENLVLRQVRDKEFARGPVIDWRKAEAFAAAAVTRFDIRTPSLATAARTLSGGNVQKIVLARELSGRPSLVVASHPTYGLDVGSAAMTHERLLAQRERGAAVVLISEDLDELRALSDTIVVLFAGRVAGTLPISEAVTEAGWERLGLLMGGSAAA
ncbi:MAG: ABC transporter ATP-binding protein [Trueperaceae bacterium]|nr:ABC transporter ATP-binding protein [Trueperaceae bacterium]